MRDSIFDDPGDEKSWHASQRSESLSKFYEGREPSWYASAIAPLQGAARVLDLGCGPGLALKALLEQGASSVLGVDRWTAFATRSRSATPIIAHDLTLPMPFLGSGSFDGVFSHYALYYMSPIGTRQVLREAYRVLKPGGRLLIYVAATGMGSGDETRTIPYTVDAMRVLLADAGFQEVEVEASANGRNTVAKASRPIGDSNVAPRAPHAPIDGDTQISAAYQAAGEGVLRCELIGDEGDAVVSLKLPSASAGEAVRVSVCARGRPLGQGATELQLWAWRGSSLVASKCARFELAATEMRIGGPDELEHVSVWRPEQMTVEPPGNAYVLLSDLRSGADLTEPERGAEGRLIAIETTGQTPSTAAERLGPGANRFLIRRASGVDSSTLDREWLAGRAHGVVFNTEELAGHRDLLLWASWRQSLVFLAGQSWDALLAAAARHNCELQGPVVFVDPALGTKGSPEPLPAAVADTIGASSRLLAVLSEASRRLTAPELLQSLSGRLLHGGSGDDGQPSMQANESLRYLTERTVLMRLRQTQGRSAAEVGRRPVFDGF